MAKADAVGVGLFPALALAAGLLSGTLLRSGTPPETSKSAAHSSASSSKADQPEIAVPQRWADLRPVMDLLAEALGVSIEPNETVRAARALRIDTKRQPGLRAREVKGALTHLERTLTGPSKERTPSGDEKAAQILDGYLQSQIDPNARFHKLRAKVADRFLTDQADEEALDKLRRHVQQSAEQPGAIGQPKLGVQFLIATIPDYVDSNAGWLADETIGAIQAAMSEAGYLLDRFRLIDWSPHVEGQLVSESRLHERQPSALIFRQLDRRDELLVGLSFQVILLVPETPTSGVHRVAFRNALRFVHAWNPDEHAIRVVAPIFSGSVASLSTELGSWLSDRATTNIKASDISVVTGSAMADENLSVMNAFAGGVHYEAAVQPTSAVLGALADALGRMNDSWRHGQNVALLVESNTAFGSGAIRPKSKDAQKVQQSNGRCDSAVQPFGCATVFKFPLHIAELRNDAQTASVAIAPFLPAPKVALTFREATPAGDQIPAFRPQLTSAVVESTVNGILDNIRHDRKSAVGIVATDNRDVLFLAREVRRAVPDVQLFMVGNHLLYLNSEYLPYTRGALIGSPYPLALAAQGRVDTGAGSGSATREAFQSQIAAGVFNATLIQLGKKLQVLDYCRPTIQRATTNESETNKPGADKPGPAPCRPPVWVSVIGDDTYWPLNASLPDTKGLVDQLIPAINARPVPLNQPPLSFATELAGGLVAVFVLGHVATAVYIRTKLKKNGIRQFLRQSVVRVLAPPVTYPSAAGFHSLALAFTFSSVACLSAWTAAVFALHWTFAAHLTTGVPAALSAAFAFAVVIAAGMALWNGARQRDCFPFADPPPNPDQNPRLSRWLILALILLTLSPLVCSLWFVEDLLSASNVSDGAFKLARLLGGGIVSPGPAMICIFAAVYAGLFSGLRRLSFVGRGYAALAAGSPAFRLLAGPPRPHSPVADVQQPGQPDPNRSVKDFTALLDMPIQNLDPKLLTAIVVFIVILTSCMDVPLTTIDGRAFSWFLTLGSMTVLATVSLSLAQAATIWYALRAKLVRLARTRIQPAMESVGREVRWDFSLAPPRLADLTPLAIRADKLRRMLATAIQDAVASRLPGSSGDRRVERNIDVLEMPPDGRLAVRHQDFTSLATELNGTFRVDQLRDEIIDKKHASPLQSATWLSLWRISDRLVDLLEQVHWSRCGHMVGVATHTIETAPARFAAVVDRDVVQPSDHGHPSESGSCDRLAKWFEECEHFVALQFAFVLRDILARIMSSLFTAMLCLSLLTAAHLFYLFQGRSSALSVDLLMMAVAAVVSLSIVFDMERNAVLSQLQSTTAGRINFNWEFIKRVGVYGVLPLLVVVGSLFPEIGDSLFRWLEPLRKIATF